MGRSMKSGTTDSCGCALSAKFMAAALAASAAYYGWQFGAGEGSNHCCTWWPCSWGCKAFYWVAHWVCVFFVWVANLVCILFVLVAFFVCLIVSVVVAIVCLLWAWIEVWFCLSKANGGTALLLTDGTVLMQECQLWQATRRWWRLHPDENGSYFN